MRRPCKPADPRPANDPKKPRRPDPRNEDDDQYTDAGDIATPEPDRDDEQRGL
ncbi:MAG: hypothetical protein KDJ76_13135 [Xanthobacteraceae bacterium]|nr:hypothetical protein [Xanthobacteraceae bacterium]